VTDSKVRPASELAALFCREVLEGDDALRGEWTRDLEDWSREVRAEAEAAGYQRAVKLLSDLADKWDQHQEAHKECAADCGDDYHRGCHHGAADKLFDCAQDIRRFGDGSKGDE